MQPSIPAWIVDRQGILSKCLFFVYPMFNIIKYHKHHQKYKLHPCNYIRGLPRHKDLKQPEPLQEPDPSGVEGNHWIGRILDHKCSTKTVDHSDYNDAPSGDHKKSQEVVEKMTWYQTNDRFMFNFKNHKSIIGTSTWKQFGCVSKKCLFLTFTDLT